jgi:hypothetical protein
MEIIQQKQGTVEEFWLRKPGYAGPEWGPLPPNGKGLCCRPPRRLITWRRLGTCCSLPDDGVLLGTTLPVDGRLPEGGKLSGGGGLLAGPLVGPPPPGDEVRPEGGAPRVVPPPLAEGALLKYGAALVAPPPADGVLRGNVGPGRAGAPLVGPPPLNGLPPPMPPLNSQSGMFLFWLADWS